MKLLPSKTSIALVLLGMILVLGAIFYTGRKMIQASEVYPLALKNIQDKFELETDTLEFKLFSPFDFFEGGVRGSAEFVLCEKTKCFQVAAEKRMGDWRVKTWEKIEE